MARGRGRGLPANSTIDFRIGRREPHMGLKDATDFHVMLVDENESMSTAIPASQFSTILGPASAVDLFQTVRIPLAAFGVGANFKVRGVRFVFNVSGKGAINLSYVRVSSMSVPMGEDIAPILTPIPAEEMPTPMPLVRRPIEESGAEVAKVQMPVNSYSNVSKTHSVEIFVRSENSFPVRDQLPTLVMSGRKFSVSRYHGTGLDTLVFLLTPEEFAELPERGAMHVQYGRERAVRKWRLPDYMKSQLGR
jgi:hypothetical protein